MSDQPNVRPESRERDRTPRPPPRVIGRARVQQAQFLRSLSLQQDRLYPVLDCNPETSPPEALAGYVRLDVDGQRPHVWAAHLEVEC